MRLFRFSKAKSEKNSAQNRGGVCCFCVRVMVYSFRIISGIMKTKDVEPMDALDKARREIDTVDAALAALFERRMACRSSMPRGKPWCWTKPKRAFRTLPCAPTTATTYST